MGRATDDRPRWPLVCRAIAALPGGRSHPFLANLAFGLPWILLMVAFLLARRDGMGWPAIVSYVAGAFLWLVAPGFLYLHHARHVPRFLATGREVCDGRAAFEATLAAREPDRWRWAIAVPLFAVALGMYWAITPFLFSEGGFRGFGDPFFWAVFAAWMAWFAFMGVPGLAAIGSSLGAVRDLAAAGLRLRPLHPDGVAGLGGIGRFVVESTLGVAMACLFLPMALVALPASTARFALVAAIAVILGLLVWAFAWPMHFVRRAVQRAKDQEQERLAEDYGRLAAEVPVGKAATGKAATAASLAQLRLHQAALVARTRTIPVPVASWVLLALQALLPLTVTAVELLLKHQLG